MFQGYWTCYFISAIFLVNIGKCIICLLHLLQFTHKSQQELLKLHLPAYDQSGISTSGPYSLPLALIPRLQNNNNHWCGFWTDNALVHYIVQWCMLYNENNWYINTVVFVSPQDAHWTNQCNAACSSISYNFLKFNVMIMTWFSLSTRIRILVISIESLALWKNKLVPLTPSATCHLRMLHCWSWMLCDCTDSRPPKPGSLQHTTRTQHWNISKLELSFLPHFNYLIMFISSNYIIWRTQRAC